MTILGFQLCIFYARYSHSYIKWFLLEKDWFETKENIIPEVADVFIPIIF